MKIYLTEKRILKIALGLEFIIIFFLAYQLYFQPVPFEPLSPKEIRQKTAPIGNCIKKKPTSGNYLHVKMTIKAADINIRYFIWNGIDYARRCFDVSPNTYIYDAYVPSITSGKLAYDLIIRSTANNNEVEYKIEIFDLSDKLIHTQTSKTKIEFIKYPLIINGQIDTP